MNKLFSKLCNYLETKGIKNLEIKFLKKGKKQSHYDFRKIDGYYSYSNSDYKGDLCIKIDPDNYKLPYYIYYESKKRDFKLERRCPTENKIITILKSIETIEKNSISIFEKGESL